MSSLIVLENPRRWKFRTPAEVRIVSARDYLSDPQFQNLRGAKVFNFCRAYAYQSVGYYVSLLATARGHRPWPSVTTIQDLRSASLVKVVSEDLDALIQKSLHPLRGDRFVLSIYFGRNLAERYAKLSKALFNLFPAPFLRAEFYRNGRWKLEKLRPIATDDVPQAHREFIMDQAVRHFSRNAPRIATPKETRYDLAILWNEDEVDTPSCPKAIEKFIRAAENLGMHAQVIDKDDYGRIAEFDALFIRETTSVNHHTYRFARRAAAEGMVVIDDPESIVRCTNKVYQAEIFLRHKIPAPATRILSRDVDEDDVAALGFPVVFKQPDSSFSQGVYKAETPQELSTTLAEIFKTSELVVAQSFVKSSFDWRIGVLGGRALYACKYHMAKGHWQIQKTEDGERRSYGKVETMPIGLAPPRAIALAERCASLIGQGFYGVDLKQVDDRFLVIEINDNPNVDAGYEDKVLGDKLYDAIMRWFWDRLEARGRADDRRVEGRHV